MLIVSLFSPNDTYDALFLANYANINIIDALYRVQGVGEVRIFGAGDYAMRIWLKPDVLARLGADGARRRRTPSSSRAPSTPPGQVGAEPAPAGPGDHLHRPRAGTPADAGGVRRRSSSAPNPDGSVVRLRDVARVELGALNYQQIGRVNGQPGCGDRRLPGARLERARRSPRASASVMDELQKPLPARPRLRATRSTRPRRSRRASARS